MLKKLALLVVTAVLGAVFAATLAKGQSGLTPTDKGVHLAAGTNPTITAIGKTKFSNVTLGGTECPVEAEVQITGATSTSHLVEFKVTNLAECVMNGALATSCAKLASHEPTGTGGKPLSTANGGAWLGTSTLNAGVSSGDILSEIVIHETYEPKPGEAGALCPGKLKLESTATSKPTVTFDSATGATKGVLGGTLTATFVKNGAHLGNINISGSLTIQAPNSGTYGVT